MDEIKNINAKIESLRKQKAKMQMQQAIHFVREVQKIFQDDFTPEMVLGILSTVWGTASETQKQNWRRGDFHPPVIKQDSLALGQPSTKDELIRAYEVLCEEFLEVISSGASARS